MKVFELLHESRDSWSHLTDEDFNIAFNAINKQRPMTGPEIQHTSMVLTDEGYTRGPSSAAKLLTRMHVAIHGKFPTGYKPNENWVNISKNLYDFLDSKGYNADENLQKIHDEMGIPYSNAKYKGIPVKQKTRTPRSSRTQLDVIAATEIMAKAARSLHPEIRKKLLPHRDEIIEYIRKGLTAKEAFDRLLDVIG